MATPKKLPNGRWFIQIEVDGVRQSKVFDTRREALDWQAGRTTEIRLQKSGRAGTKKTLRDALRRYAEDVSPTKRGEHWEIVRLKAYEKQNLPIDQPLASLTTAQLVNWRDSRLAVTARGSVLRDMTLLGNVLELARREWQWLDKNPMRDVKRPASPDHRERVITGLEIRKMLRALEYGWPVRSVSQAVAVAFLFALCTGMRAGEICAVEHFDVHRNHVRLHTSKTGGGRDVPLSAVAKRLLDQMQGWDADSVFGLKSQTLDALFRRARKRAGLDGFTFHDSRHTAATRIAQKIHVLDLCRMFGWSNPKMAMTYYQPKASDIAAKL